MARKPTYEELEQRVKELEKEATKRKDSEVALRLQNGIARNMSEGVYLIRTSDGVIIYTNPRFEEIFGYGPDEMVGKDVSIVNAPTEMTPEHTVDHIVEIMKQTGGWRGEIQNIRKDGTPFWCYASASLLEHPEYGEIIISVHTDITERKRLEEELKKHRDHLEELVEQRTAELTGINEELELEIEERKQAEVALRESEERYRRITEAITDYIYAVRVQDGRPVETIHGPGCVGVTGNTAEDFENNQYLWIQMVHEEDRKAVEEQAARVFSDAGVEPLEHRIIRKDGALRWVRNSPVPHYDNQGRLLSYDGLIQDVTERKEAEEEIQRNYDTQNVVNSLLQLSLEDIPLEELLEQCLDSILSIPWLAFESKGCILLVQDDPQVLVMKTQNALSEGIQKACATVPFGRCHCGRAALTLETQFSNSVDERHEIRPEGMVPHGHYCVPVLSADKIFGVINLYLKEGHCRDQREGEFLNAVANTLAGIIIRRHAEQEKEKVQSQLRQAQKMEALGTLAGGIAHDFNNILGAIMGYTEIAQFDVAEESELKVTLDEVLKSAKRARDLVKQILAFSRQEDHELKPLQVHLIVKEALKLLRASIPTTIEIRQDIKSRSGMVMGDPTQIHQVLMNLCTNATHAMRGKGGALEVGLEDVDLDADAPVQYPDLKPGPYVRLTVSDTGHGIEPEAKDRIFDPYFTTKDKGVGTGLGLAVVHGIVKSHGGAITVYSELGKGTTFHVLFPGIESVDAEETEVLEPLPKGDERILFVDDEEALVQIGQHMLRRLSYEVVPRTSSVEALEAFRAQPDKFDLVITDQTMPNMTGEMLAKELMSIRPDIPIILCTGYSELISKELAKAMGIREYVMKPLVIRKLATTIRKVLDKD